MIRERATQSSAQLNDQMTCSSKSHLTLPYQLINLPIHRTYISFETGTLSRIYYQLVRVTAIAPSTCVNMIQPFTRYSSRAVRTSSFSHSRSGANESPSLTCGRVGEVCTLGPALGVCDHA